ncbi:phage terminase small subunit P27 family [Franconibacter helveticus]|uniref:phage terminase small subunit P27 family n=1 Tax=Franconibacter helveticus TaxID=357240 RepID=UPI0029102A34|nr:phage terminase small subunit P27 family [Franconibacter helveticus]MDU6924013.1 phage terminase small subunit P27 family [Franconibacter helveticus]
MANVRATGGGRKGNLPAKLKSSITRIAPPPELLSDVAVKIWKTQSKILIERGLLEPEDAPILLAYCNAFHLMIEADKMLAEDGLTDVGGTGGLKKHPAVNVRNDCVAQLARLGSLLGLDPLSRVRMQGGGRDDDEDNEFDEF